MYHPYNKNDVRVRNALYTVYNKKCFYCKRPIEWRDMFIDHIVPDHLPDIIEDDAHKYLNKLNSDHFVKDSIENYLPSCYSCNNAKRNKVFSEASLRYLHEIARSNIDKVLSLIAKDASLESYYEPVDTNIWEEIDFSIQHDLSYAIMGYRLSHLDVLSCPRLPQVSKIKKQLDIVAYTFVSGDPGCGKSISAFQAAYDFYKAGWHVYKYNAYNNNPNQTKIPHYYEKSIYIVDDVQLLPDQIVDSLQGQAQANSKVIFCRTIPLSPKDDTIIISKKEAVNVLYNSYLNIKEKIIPIVHKYDKNIGISLTDTSIEHRLSIAKKADSPWQFNYILRGGWQTMLDKYNELCSYNNRDLLVAVISACQVLKLDHSVDFNWVCQDIYSISNSVYWTLQDLSELVNQNIVLSEKDVRIVHIESANIIISYFIEKGEKWKLDILLEFIERNYINKSFSTLGIVWLANGIRSHSTLYNTHFIPITDKIISYTLNNIKRITSSKERAEIAYFLDLIIRTKNAKYLHYYYEHEETLVDWIEHADSQSAYPYSAMINTLINHDKNEYRNIVLQIDWRIIQQSLRDDPTPNYYMWGKLLERLLCFLSKSECLAIGETLKSSVDFLVSNANISNIAPLTAFFCSIIRSNEINIRNAIRILIPVYKKYFATDMIQALDIFDFNFLISICGFNFFGIQRPTKQQIETASLFVSAIPEKAMANTISNCFPRDWHTVQYIMELIYKYDRKKVKSIIVQIHLDTLSKNAVSSWTKCDEITEICYILSLCGTKIAKSFIDLNAQHIQTIFSTFIVLSPNTSIKLFDAGHKVELVSDHWWNLCLSAMKKLINTNKEKAISIISSSMDNIVQSVNSSTILECNDTHFLDCIIYMKNTLPDIFKDLSSKIDKKHIIHNFDNSAIDPHKKAIVEKRKRAIFCILDIE